MKCRFAFSGMVILYACAVNSVYAQQAIDPRVRTQLVAAREAVWRAYFQGDSAALVRLLPERMTAMGRDRAEIIHDAQDYARNGGKYVGMEFTNESFFVNGNTALLWSDYTAHLTDDAGTPNDRKGRAIELFVKQNGRWINPHWHLDGEKSPKHLHALHRGDSLSSMPAASRLKPWMLVSAAWIGPAIFAVFNRLAQGRLNGWDPATAPELIFTGGDWFLYAFITPAAFAVSRRWPLTRPRLARRIWVHLAFALLFCVFWATLGKILGALLSIIFVPNAWHDAMAAGAAFRQHAFNDWLGWALTTLPYGVAVYLAMVGVEHAIRYFVEVREQEVHVAQLSEQLADAKLAALQAQLNPHFLFNALNTIAVHARDGDGAGTARIVEQLSDVLRRTLGRHRTNEVSLLDELDLVQQYLAIEQARFSDRLQGRFDVDAAVGSAAVPGFMLQHLVENAVRHGIARRSGPGLVVVSARRNGDVLVLTVTDDGVGFDPDVPTRAGHGIVNTRDRLRTLYGDRASLAIVRNADGGMTAEIKLPWHEVVAGELRAAE